MSGLSIRCPIPPVFTPPTPPPFAKKVSQLNCSVKKTSIGSVVSEIGKKDLLPIYIRIIFLVLLILYCTLNECKDGLYKDGF